MDKNFVEEIEKRVLATGDSYINTICEYCEEFGIDIEYIPRLINKSIKEKIQMEAIDLHYLPKIPQLPLDKQRRK